MATTTTNTNTGEEASERQRKRAERGLRSTQSVKSDRLPPAPRERKPGLAALAVLLIVGGAALAGLLAIRADERVPVIVASANISAGEQITEAHLGTMAVAADSDSLLIPESQTGQLVGQYATVDIADGQLVDTTMVGGEGLLDEGEVIVGATLAEGRMPGGGLSEGDDVDLIRVVDGEADVLVRDAEVSYAEGGGEGDGFGASGQDVSFILSREQAPEIAAVAAAGELAVIQVTAGPAGSAGE